MIARPIQLSFSPFSFCTPRLRLIVAPHCHTNDTFPFATKFSFSSRHPDRSNSSFRAAHVACGPSRIRIGLDRIYVGKDFYRINLTLCTFSFISFFFRHTALYSRIPSFILAISDTAHLTPPSSTHPSSRRPSLDYDSGNIASFVPAAPSSRIHNTLD